jgi:hypothetical protein
MQALFPFDMRLNIKGMLLPAGKVGKKRKVILRYTVKKETICV